MADISSVKYDESSDVLYIATKPGREARTRETLPGVLWRYDLKDGTIVGVTIMDYSYYWLPRISDLSRDIGKHLHMGRGKVQSMLEKINA